MSRYRPRKPERLGRHAFVPMWAHDEIMELGRVKAVERILSRPFPQRLRVALRILFRR